MNRHEHLRLHIESFTKEHQLPVPRFYKKLGPAMYRITRPNIIYPLTSETFAHIFVDRKRKRNYHLIEPQLTESEQKKYREILDRILEIAPSADFVYEDRSAFEKAMQRLIRQVTGRMSGAKAQVNVTPAQFKKIMYFLKRDLLDNGRIEPLLHDPYIEDIHNVGTKDIYVVHKIFGMLRTNVKFKNLADLDSFLRTLSERIGKPVSDAQPIVDAALSDGSRINIIYSDDVSREGPSFTIRMFTEEPMTITQLVKLGTFSPEIAAYLWLALEHSMNVIISGETASGKTTSLNALLTFINHNFKIYSAEDTPEIVVPHAVWQRLVTRETGPEASRVELFDLVKAALRSRPDYIVIGEVRGREGNVAFQAMQTGHPVISTFHASSIQKLIQRFTGDPINVPIRFIDNLNIALFQLLIYENGRIIRRCNTVEEILRYSPAKGGVLTRTIFQWDPVDDRHHFRGRYNSHVLEDLIAPKLGILDVRDIYKELDRRAGIIDRMVRRNILGYKQVNAIFRRYYEKGMEGIPSYLR